MDDDEDVLSCARARALFAYTAVAGVPDNPAYRDGDAPVGMLCSRPLRARGPLARRFPTRDYFDASLLLEKKTC